MTLWRFLSAQSDVPLSRVMAIAGISGLSNAMLLAVINRAAYSASPDGMNIRMFVLFLIAIAIYIVTQGYILRVSSIEVEKIIARLRVSLSDKVRHADLQSLEHLGRAELYSTMNTETLTISQTTAPMILAGQGAILVLFSLCYLFYLSRVAFFLTLVIVSIGVFVHTANKQQLKHEMERASARENEFFEVLTHLIDGFKEVKVNAARGRDLYQHLKEIAGQVATLKTKTAVRYADKYIFSQVLFYLLIGAMVFIVPTLTTVTPDDIQQITASILFIIGPLSMVVGAYPGLSRGRPFRAEHPPPRGATHARAVRRRRKGPQQRRAAAGLRHRGDEGRHLQLSRQQQRAGVHRRAARLHRPPRRDRLRRRGQRQRQVHVPQAAHRALLSGRGHDLRRRRGRQGDRDRRITASSTR